MKLSAARACALAMACVGFAAVMLLGQQGPATPEYRVPLVQDWTHRSLIYSAPRSIFQNLQLQQQPRYIQQYLRRNVFSRGPVGPPVFDPIRILRSGTSGLQRDWGIVAGAGFTVGQGNYPAKYVFNVNATPSCTADYVVFTTNQGAGLDIYAVNHLYVNAAGTGLCTGTTPTILWAYHVQSGGGTSNTSPVISLAGDQIVWVEGGGGNARLHILKPYMGGADGTIAAPHTPTASGTAAAYRTCTPAAPVGATSHACLFNITFTNGKDDTGDGATITPSSPYYEYGNDSLFVGDDGGNLHQFTNIFYGSPAEVTTGGWPVATLPADTNPELGSPVIDDTSGNAFFGDTSGRIFYVRLFTTSAGTCNAASHGGVPPCVGSTTYTDGDTGATTTKISAAPIVDSTTQRVFVFFSPNGGGPGAYVGQDDTTLSAGAQVTVNVGTGTAWRLNQGMLDNAYYNTDTGLGTGNGFLYFCGNAGATGTTINYALLERIAVTNGKLGSTVDPTNWLASNASSRCSPVSEFYNATTSVDYLFFGVESGGAATACAGNGCVYSTTITGGTLTVPPAAGTGAANASGGTSGIIEDNDSNSTGASSIYFTWLANGTGTATYPCGGVTTTSVCAVKFTQALLQ
ncbi:MAG: hypothetical protein ACLP1Y_02970 [Candidatus Acidiferrales bacterium]